MAIPVPIFNTFIVPGAIKDGKLQLSLYFDLNTEHPVFVKLQNEAVIASWKEEVLKFPDVSRFIHQNGQLNLRQPNSKDISLTAINQAKASDTVVKTFWATFLGYQPNTKGSFEPRIKTPNIRNAGIADMETVNVLPKTPPLKIKGYAIMDQLDPNEQKAFIDNPKSLFPGNMDEVLSSLKLHPLLVTSKTAILPQQITEGIGNAYQSEVLLNERRFELLKDVADLYIYEGITVQSSIDITGLSSESQKSIRNLYDFQRIAKTVVNEPTYIKEAIQKIGGILAAQKFVGTLIDFEFPISELTSSFLQIGLSTDAINADPSVASFIDLSFRTNITTDPTLKVVVPAVIESKYKNFYESTLAKLNQKAKIITYETESIQRNLAQAEESIRQDPTLANLTLDILTFQKSKMAISAGLSPVQKVEIQSSIIKYQALNKAAIKLNNRIANLQTKGHYMILTEAKWLDYNPNEAARPSKQDVYEHDILNGYVVYQRIKENGEVLVNWKSLNRINEYFGETSKKKKFIERDLAVDTDSFVNSLVVSAAGDHELQGINNGFLFQFDGTTVSSRNPLKHYEREYEKEEDQRSEDIREFAEKSAQSPAEATVLYLSNKKLLAEDYFPFKKKVNATYVLARDFIFKTGTAKVTPRLKFSDTRTYEYIMAMQYLNGFSPVNENWLKQADETFLKDFISEEAKFLRHDHIKEIIVSLGEDIFYSGTKKPKKQFVGETANDLVIRKGSLLNNDECVRYLLPPPVPTFQTYLWYDFENKGALSQSRDLSPTQLFPYYNKYQCELKSVDEFNAAKPGKPACKQNCGGYCGGTAQPPVYSGKLNYLPDPIVNGYKIKFYYDKKCEEPADQALYPDKFCPIQKGVYPQLLAWAVKLVRTKPKKNYVDVNPYTQELKIYVPDGKQVYAECWPTYHKDLACFEEEFITIASIQEEIENEMTVNPLHAAATVLSFTSAIQKPLFAPEILDISFTRYKKGKRTITSVTANVSLKFEHLNNWGELQVQGSQPTGELELYGLWDDYSTNKRGPQKSIADKITASVTGGFVYLGKIVFENPEDPRSFYPQKMLTGTSALDDISSSELKADIVFEFEPSFPIHYFTPSIYKVRNTSKYISYFEDVNAMDKDQLEKEEFSRWSKEVESPAKVFSPINYSAGNEMASSGYLFNNLKPAKPVIEKIIPLIVRDDQKTVQKVTYYERFRIYYHPALTGREGRLGIIIQDTKTVYPSQFQGYISHAGIDSVMDNFADRLDLDGNMLSRKNFNIDPVAFEEHYIEKFAPQLDDFYSVAAEKIGLISYTPDYDLKQKLWYVDIELKLKNKAKFELHSPFIQLGLVSYQPRSANYAFKNGAVADTVEAYQDDLRLSDPIKADFFSIRPQRTFKNPFVLFKHGLVNKFSLSGAVSSLYFKDHAVKKSLKSEFVLCVEEEGDGDFQNVVTSRLFHKTYKLNDANVGTAMSEVELRYHPLLTGLEGLITSYNDQLFEVEFNIWFKKVLFGKHRIVIYEIECHNKLDLNDLPSLLQKGRIQHINGVNVINNYIFSRADSV